MLVYLYGYLISFKDGQYISLLQFIFPVYMLPDILNEQIKKKKNKTTTKHNNHYNQEAAHLTFHWTVIHNTKLSFCLD